MNLPDQDPKVRAWKGQPDLPFFDQSHLPDHNYVHTNILGPSANRSRRRINYTIWFLGFAAVTWILAMIF